MSSSDLHKLRIAIVGGCQVVGLAEAARRFAPEAEVRAWAVEVVSKETPEEIATQLSGFDLVISQIADAEKETPLTLSRLRDMQLPVTFLPTLAFTGFHPDCSYIRNGKALIQGPGIAYHSLLIAAAHTLGIPQRRVPDLFNAYIFAELGYLDAFDAAKKALITIFRASDYDLTSSFELWLSQVGQFMYTINHPHIFALATLCRQALARAGHIDPVTPIPEGVTDYLGTHFTWPIYPAIAKQIGICGSTVFKRNSFRLPKGQSRDIPLTEFVSSFYDVYDKLEKGALNSGNVAKACRRLEPLISF